MTSDRHGSAPRRSRCVAGQAEASAMTPSGLDLVASIVAETAALERTARVGASSMALDLVEHATAPSTAPGLAEQIATPATGGGSIALVGLCVDDRHPSLAGRVLVRTADGAGERERWLATLAHLPVRREDRVLLLQPGNWPEPLVVGVIDGLRPRTAVNSRGRGADPEGGRDAGDS